MSNAIPAANYLYWFSKEDFSWARNTLETDGYRLTQTLLTPCQVLKTKGKKLVYAPPSVWSRVCVRQGSWYRDSNRRGKYMLMSDHRLPKAFERFFDLKMEASDFIPEQLPSNKDLEAVVNSKAYQDNKPAEWENIGIKDAAMFKTLFSATGFWGVKDNLDKHWLTQKANHANFLSHTFTTQLGDEKVPYSISENAGVCSSCVEFFNIIDQKQRKLVTACPGAVIFGGVERNTYYDLKPSSDEDCPSEGSEPDTPD